MDSDVRSGVVTERMVQQTGLMLAGAVLTYFVSQSGYMLRSYPSQLIDCLIWLYPTCLWKICSKDFEPEYPPNNQTRFFSHLLPNVVPRLTLRGGWGTYPLHKDHCCSLYWCYFQAGEKVCPSSDLPFFSSLPRGLCNAGGLAADVPYSHLDTKDATYLLCTWLKAPRKKPECNGIAHSVKSVLDKSDTAGCSSLNYSCNFFFFFLTNKLHIEKVIHVAIAISILFLLKS